MSKRKTEHTQAPAPHARVTKLDTILSLLRTESGADVQTLAAATGWQAHSIRGAIAGQIKRKLRLTVATQRVEGRTVYRIHT